MAFKRLYCWICHHPEVIDTAEGIKRLLIDEMEEAESVFKIDVNGWLGVLEKYECGEDSGFTEVVSEILSVIYTNSKLINEMDDIVEKDKKLYEIITQKDMYRQSDDYYVGAFNIKTYESIFETISKNVVLGRDILDCERLLVMCSRSAELSYYLYHKNIKTKVTFMAMDERTKRMCQLRLDALAKRGVDITNYEVLDYTVWDILYMKKKERKNLFKIDSMKFENIIANPPYQRNLHLEIDNLVLKHILKENGTYVSLSPVSLFTIVGSEIRIMVWSMSSLRMKNIW